MTRSEKMKVSEAGGKERHGSGIFLLNTVMLIALFAALAWGFLAPGPESSGLAQLVDDALLDCGVESRVTAVLLNYRAYDTLLECFVLFLGVAVVWSMCPSRSVRQDSPVGPVLLSLVRLLVPLLALVGIYLLWAGSSQAGGAFQAGAIFGGAGVLLLLTSSRLLGVLPGKLLAPGICLGPVFFLLIAVSGMALGGHFLEYRGGSAAVIIIALEVMASFSIGLSLTVFFAGSRPEESSEKAGGPGVSPGEGEAS